MFKGLFDAASLMKQAQEFGGKMQGIQEQLAALRVKGSAGGRLVEVEINGLQEMFACKIDPALIARGDTEFLEELIVSAVNEAVAESRRHHAEMMQELTGGMNMPGLEEAMGRLMSK